MQVELTSPAKGKMPGENVTVTDGEGRWLLANGYARVDDDGDHRLDSSVEASADPTLAANREAPGTPPGTIANQGEQDEWTTKVADAFEFKGKSGTGAARIVPGDPKTQVAALEKTLGEDQPAASEVVETEDPLAEEDLEERPEITAADSQPKTTRKR